MAAKRTQMQLHSRDGVDSKVSKPNTLEKATDNSPVKNVKGIKNSSKTYINPNEWEEAMSDANRGFNTLLLEFVEVLRERVAVDSLPVKELDDILMEARSLEAHLKEKKEQLKRSLAVISEKLEG